MSSPRSWEITPDPFGDTRVPLHDTLFGTWDADKLELIGEEYEISEKEYHEEGMEDKEGEEGEGSRGHGVGKETNEEPTLMMPYYPSSRPRIRRTARMSVPQVRKALPVSRNSPPRKRAKTTSGKAPKGVRSAREVGESSHAPEGMDEIAGDRVISTNTLMEEMKKEIHSLKERVQGVEGENNENRVNLQQIHNYMGVAYNNVEAYMTEANQRREQLEAVTGALAQQVMITDARSVMTETRVGACEQEDNGMQWQINNLTYLFGSRFGFP